MHALGSVLLRRIGGDGKFSNKYLYISHSYTFVEEMAGFEKSFRGNWRTLLVELFRNPIFLVILGIKIIASLFFISDIPSELFVPFLSFFAENPGINPYQHFFEIGVWKAFPYAPLMMYITGLPFVLLRRSSESVLRPGDDRD